jgi:hypothetical protein
MHEELQAFLEAPSARTYRCVREALLDEVASASPEALSLTVLVELTELAATGEFAALLARTEELAPLWALSPRLHYLAAWAADELGDAETADLERFTFQTCLEGILATGHGTPDSPYLITYVSDEYDVAAALGLEPRSQSLVEQPGYLCDVVKCLDGEEIWFELTGCHGLARAPELSLVSSAARSLLLSPAKPVN